MLPILLLLVKTSETVGNPVWQVMVLLPWWRRFPRKLLVLILCLYFTVVLILSVSRNLIHWLLVDARILTVSITDFQEVSNVYLRIFWGSSVNCPIQLHHVLFKLEFIVGGGLLMLKVALIACGIATSRTIIAAIFTCASSLAE